MSTLVAVVIPFYQRTSGLLRQAVASALEQVLPDHHRLVVVVVDDASPVHAYDDLAELSANPSVVILTKANEGVAAARNSGLDYLRDLRPTYVSFLDSDDAWVQGHLLNAIRSLDHDADMYYGNHKYLGSEISAFERSSTIKAWVAGVGGNPDAVRRTNDPDVYEFAGAFAADQFALEYTAHTSTVVYRYERLSDLRFNRDLRTAGEDSMFWIDVALHSRIVRFTTKVCTICGYGESIFQSSLSWSHPLAHRRHAYSVLFNTIVLRKPLSQDVKVRVRQKLRRSEAAFLYLLLRKMVKTGSFDRDIVGIVLRSQWSLAFRFPYRLLCAVGARKNEQYWS